MKLAGSIDETHVEVVELLDSALDPLPGSQGHHSLRCPFTTRGESPRGGIEQCLLQIGWTQLGADMGKIAGRRVAPCTTAGTPEPDLSGLRVACDNVEDFISTTIGSQLNPQVKKLRNLIKFGIAERWKLWHPATDPTIVDHRSDQLTF